VTPDITPEALGPEIIAPSTAGMTTRVVKGSLWTLAGQVLPLFATLLSTPLVIRFLGSESYGVLILVGLIPSYFAFADVGMGLASTKFASGAYAEGSPQRESEFVWTSGLIILISSLVVAIPLFLFSGWIVGELNVPDHVHTQASIGLKITSAAFVISCLAGVFNTPELTRLRMDLNTVNTAASKFIIAIGAPLFLYLGWGLLGAIWVGFFAGALALAGHFYFSSRLLPRLVKPAINFSLVRPLLKFGSGLLLAGIAAVFLVNLEKLLLTRMISVQSLAHYSVAYSFALMATMFSSAMLQSLIPAFSQLLAPEKRTQFNALYSRGIRLIVISLLPAIMLMFVGARPFFTIWAGPEFGAGSTLPFYILLVGLFFNILAYIPHGAIMASGRTDLFAKLYWIELVIYASLAAALIYEFQVPGAAMAWSLRVMLDAFVITWLAKRIAGVTFRFSNHLPSIIGGIIILVPTMVLTLYNNYSLWLIALVPVSLLLYGLLIWQRGLEADEIFWIRERLDRWLRLVRRRT